MVPGETSLAFYTAENLTTRPIVGISTYNIIPFQAAKYFNKIQVRADPVRAHGYWQFARGNVGVSADRCAPVGLGSLGRSYVVSPRVPAG